MKKDLKGISGIFPMPVLMIGTYNEDGSVDVMNAAWGMAQSMKHLKLCLSESHKTVKNIKRTKACSVSLAVKSLLEVSDYFGIVSANDVHDKFEKSNLHASHSKNIDAPIVEEYPLTMECKLVGFEEDGVLLEVVNVLVDEKYLNKDGKIDLSKLEVLAYDPYGNGYYVVKEKVGQAFSSGIKLKNK